MTIVSLIGIIFSTGPWVVAFAGGVGFTTAMTFALMLALPPRLSAPGDVHRTAAGMFTVSYTLAVIIPTLSGAIWDLSGVPWMGFVPLATCSVVLTLLGVLLSRYDVAHGRLH
jgi:CP family cyanate transporter-like MFS transporter